MKAFSLYDRTSTFGGVYVMLISNRIQILFFIFVLPTHLIYPYMIWGIVAFGLLSQINLMLLSKWISSDVSPKDAQGFVQLFGERKLRFFAFIGFFLLLLKITVIALSYVDMVHHFIFPSMNIHWLLLFIFLISCYSAAHGMEKTIRFVVIAFLFSFWMIFLFFPFFFPPTASLHDLYPLLPDEGSMHSWQTWLFLWSSFSGPEYLICLAPWLNHRQKILKYLTFANLMTALEYIIIFVASLFFFGSDYLSKTTYPVVNMIRYLQSPALERVDILLLSVHMIHFVFSISILLLCFYGSARILLGRILKPTTRIGFASNCVMIFLSMIAVSKWFWKDGDAQNMVLTLESWSGALTYLLVPVFLLLVISTRKGNN